MTCKDCVHYTACKSLLEAMGYTVDGDGKNADKRCDTFETLDSLRPHGEWQHLNQRFQDGGYYDEYGCSKCDHVKTIRIGGWLPNFCPNCGADMRKSERII